MKPKTIQDVFSYFNINIGKMIDLIINFENVGLLHPLCGYKQVSNFLRELSEYAESRADDFQRIMINLDRTKLGKEISFADTGEPLCTLYKKLHYDNVFSVIHLFNNWYDGAVFLIEKQLENLINDVDYNASKFNILTSNQVLYAYCMSGISLHDTLIRRLTLDTLDYELQYKESED